MGAAFGAHTLRHYSVDAGSAYSERSGDLRRSHSASAKVGNLGFIDARLSASVNAAVFRSCNPVPLPLTSQVIFELGNGAQDRERQLARATGGVDELAQALERDPTSCQLIQHLVEIDE
jgi:hypothetical protein